MRYLGFYSQYLDLPAQPDKDKEFIDCKCPLHEGGRRNAGVNLKNGVFNCYNCGALSPARFLNRLHPDMSFQECTAIVDEYRRENKLVQKIETFVNNRVIKASFNALYKLAMEQDLSGLDIAVDYAEGRGLTVETLRQAGIGFLDKTRTHWKRDSLVFPYTVDGRVVGLRYRDAEGSKGGEPGCHFTLFGLDTITDDHDVAVVVEGESDRLRTMQELQQAGFEGVVVSTPTSTFRHEWAREFEGYHKVVIIPQADEASLKTIEKAKAALHDRCAIVHLPWRRRQIGKDVCDWLHYNDGHELRALIERQVGDSTRRIMVGKDFETYANKPRRYLIDKLLARREVCVIAGPQKSFKTWLLLNMTKTLLTPGTAFCGIPDLVSQQKYDPITGEAKPIKVMIIEEEGDAEGLYDRAKIVFKDIPGWKENTLWGHHLGVKLDEESWISELERHIEDEGVDVLVLDPFQRLHNKDENSSTDMGEVWNNIHRLTTRFKDLSIVILHHFSKQGAITDGWNAFRGSSRTAGEADLGIFVEKRPRSEALGIKVRFDGRSIGQIETADGSDVWKLAFLAPTGELRYDTAKVVVSKHEAVLSELILKGREGWEVPAIGKHYGVSTQIAQAWCDKLVKENKARLEKPTGKPVIAFAIV